MWVADIAIYYKLSFWGCLSTGGECGFYGCLQKCIFACVFACERDKERKEREWEKTTRKRANYVCLCVLSETHRWSSPCSWSLTMNSQSCWTHTGGGHSAGGRCHSCARGGTESSLSDPEARSLSARLPWKERGREGRVGEEWGEVSQQMCNSFSNSFVKNWSHFCELLPRAWLSKIVDTFLHWCNTWKGGREAYIYI